jgi:diguanylate cyclase (GGDEF)-like protein
MIDVDHFKSVNDIHGHHAGDLVLVELSRLMESLIRGRDVVGRWGGEEFLILAPGITRTQAAELAERLRAAVERHHFAGIGTLSISVGVAELHADVSLTAAVEAADAALYAPNATAAIAWCCNEQDFQELSPCLFETRFGPFFSLSYRLPR